MPTPFAAQPSPPESRQPESQQPESQQPVRKPGVTRSSAIQPTGAQPSNGQPGSPLDNRLRGLVRRGRVLTSPAQLAGYDADGLGYKRFLPDAVVIPADADELVSVVRELRGWDLPVVLRGAGTSLAGGPVAAQGGIVIHTSALRSISQIDPEGLWCEVECGVTLKQLEQALQPLGLFYPPDPSSGIVCTLGGNVAMNAGGAHCFRLGVTGNYVLGVEVVLLDGSVQRFGGPAGGLGDCVADWKRLMVGSEGTLGTFTRFWLRLLPISEKAWTFRATFADLRTAERAIHALVADPVCPVAIELMDPRFIGLVENSPMAVGLPRDAFVLITEIDGPAAWVDHHVLAVAALLREAGATDLAWSDDPVHRDKLWKARKVAGGLMGQMSPDFVVQDAVIPKRALAETLDLIYREADAANIPVINVFHAGDGNLHPNFLFDSKQPHQLEAVEAISKRLMSWVVEVGGTLSGEHGIGNDKMDYMPFVFDADTMGLQWAVPAVFNPQHRWNPLKVFRHRRFADPAADVAGQASESRSPETPAPIPLARPRLFEPFFDPVDGVIAVPAETTPDELRRRIGPWPYRFPLLVDPVASLAEHWAAGPYAPASSRFGPWCDNVIGMNWRLTDGRVVRLGERVVKSTTGYDLFRFFLNSGERFGTPIDWVLRLRPAQPRYAIFELTGASESLDRAGAVLRRCDWGLWFDSVERIIDFRDSLPANAASDRESDPDSLRLVANVAADQRVLFEAYLRSLATEMGLGLSSQDSEQPPRDGLADWVLKTTPDRAAALGASFARATSARTQSQVLTGAVLVYLDQGKPSEQSASELRDRWMSQAGLSELGGQIHSRWLASRDPLPAESVWLQGLAGRFRFPAR